MHVLVQVNDQEQRLGLRKLKCKDIRRRTTRIGIMQRAKRHKEKGGKHCVDQWVAVTYRVVR
jgi:hypothetical protein